MRKFKIIGRGFAGWHADAGSMSSSGGTLEGYVKEAENGAVVYDAERAEPGAYIDLVVNGPMCKLSLPPGTVDRFSNEDRAAAERMTPGLEGSFKTLAKLAQSETYTGLDWVALDVYVGLLKQVPGVKLGTVENGQVVWEQAVLPGLDCECSVESRHGNP